MSTFKKVISIVLCIAMLAGTFAMLGGLATPEASAAAGTSQIDSYESLAAAYDNFVYFGTEFYELDITVNDDGTYSDPQNQELTDYYVDAGQILEARMYIKSDMYMGNGQFFIAYDNAFFDVKHPTAELPNNSTTGYTNGQAGVVNTEHPVYISNGIKNSMTTGACSSVNWMIQRSGYTTDELALWDYTQNTLTYTDNGTNSAYLFMSDDWVYSWYIKVKDDVAEGVTGVTETKPGFWKCHDKTAAATTSSWNSRQSFFQMLPRPADATAADDAAVLASATKNCYVGYTTFNYFLYEDLKHTFTCGKNPNDSGSTEPSGPIAGTSQIDSYESLAAAYDNFVYFGTEVYEIDITENDDGTYGEASNHILTDYYVDAGQILEVRMYIKSDMYMGNGQFFIAYDNAFFDVKHPTAELPNNSTTGYTNGQTGVVNTAHPVYISNGIKNSMTTGACSSVNWMIQRSGYTTDELALWDYTQNTLTYTDNGTNSAYLFMSDDWVYSWYIKVKDDVAEGVTGVTETKPGFWKCHDKTAAATTSSWNSRQSFFQMLPRPADATAADDAAVLASATKNCYVGYTTFNYFLYEDLKHTFTCGKNPNAGTGTVKKYTVSFVENDGTAISSADYVKDAAVAVPEAVANQVGWANSSTGKMVDLTDYKATTNVEFKRVLSTDEFTVTVNLNGGEYADGAPEGATVENGSLVVKGNINEEIDFTKIPVPTKAGYTGTWNAESVTIDNIKGVTAGITWTANEYTVKFYNSKTDTEPCATVTAVYGKNITNKDYTVPAAHKFAGWADMDTDELVSAKEGFMYKFAEEKSFYATWTKFDSSITFMVRDYEAGSGWVVGSVVYGDAGSTLKKADVVKALDAAATSIDASVAYMPGTTIPMLYSNEETTGALVGINNGLEYNGDTVYYICTSLVFNVTWKVPVFDADAGEFTGYTETKATASTGATTSIYSVTLKTTADTTPPAGYTFNGWVNEATGEAVEYNSNLGVTLDRTYGKDVVFVADFAETEYIIAFNMQNKYDDGKITMGDTLKVGESIDVEGATFTNALGNEVTLPVVDVENSQQATKFMNMNGYKFIGWKLGTGANAKDITFPEELTYDMIDDYAVGTTITIYAQWEALEYELRFFYATPETDLSADLADREYTKDPYVVKYKTGEKISRDVDKETSDKIEANTPEGYKFLQWRRLDGKTIDSTMPAFGLDLYATYLPLQIEIYVDYNNNDLPLIETMRLAPEIRQNPVYYGDDVEAIEDVDAGIAMGTGTLIKRQIITDGNRPGENYEVVAWNIYHVEAGKDVYNTENWKEGVNDEGTTNAYSTLIYQPEWKHHSEFFFRIYGTDGKLYSALGKNFKLYYWENNYVCERGDTKINKDPENNIILLYIPTIENWDWDRFFDCDMWSSITLRIDPFDVPKSVFTLESFLALMSALGTLIKNLL